MDKFTTIPQFEDYKIDNQGVIISTKRGIHYMSYKYDKDGYATVGLRKNNKKYFRRVHRLVAETFINNPNNLPIVNHIDGNKVNNSVSNLEWCTVQYNTEHAFKVLGRVNSPTTNQECSLYGNGTCIKTFNSIKEACKYAKDTYNVSYSSMIKYKKCGEFQVKCND